MQMSRGTSGLGVFEEQHRGQCGVESEGERMGDHVTEGTGRCHKRWEEHGEDLGVYSKGDRNHGSPLSKRGT